MDMCRYCIAEVYSTGFLCFQLKDTVVRVCLSARIPSQPDHYVPDSGLFATRDSTVTITVMRMRRCVRLGSVPRISSAVRLASASPEHTSVMETLTAWTEVTNTRSMQTVVSETMMVVVMVMMVVVVVVVMVMMVVVVVVVMMMKVMV